jgi:hypothetical protein
MARLQFGYAFTVVVQFVSVLVDPRPYAPLCLLQLVFCGEFILIFQLALVLGVLELIHAFPDGGGVRLDHPQNQCQKKRQYPGDDPFHHALASTELAFRGS